MGLDVDKFELRAFIQFELGIEGARLVKKKQKQKQQPIILHSNNFNFRALLQRLAARTGQPTAFADLVVFSSVLKDTMPSHLRELALCHAAGALRPSGGRVVIFNDCDHAYQAGSPSKGPARRTGAFGPLTNAPGNSCFLERNAAPAPACGGGGQGGDHRTQAQQAHQQAHQHAHHDHGGGGGGGGSQPPWSSQHTQQHIQQHVQQQPHWQPWQQRN